MRHLLCALLICLALVSLSVGQTQTGTSRDPSCCNCGTTNSASCNTPNTLTGPDRLQADCPNGDCSSCTECQIAPNADFTNQCSANIVFIIDNSGSLRDFCVATVRPALWSFFDGFDNVAKTGGTINAAVITFSQTTTLVFPMADITAGTYLADVKTWIGGFPDPAGNHPGYCQQMSGTNWGGPLDFARQQNYGANDPDIWIFFTDGYPQCAGQFAPQTTCGRNCYNGGNSFFDNKLCNPSSTCEFNSGDTGLDFSGVSGDTRGGTWTACRAADQLKALGKKLFVVGVGGLDGHEGKIQIISGTRKWDGLPSTFGTSDYLINTDITNLGIIFQQVIAGLCDCLQAQAPCTDAGDATNSCRGTQFDSYFRVTSTASSVSTVFPGDGVVVGTLYYNFIPSPNTRIGFEFWSAGSNIGSTSTVVRTDILNPCRIQRRVNCAGGCATISEKQRLPRFFHESGDTACTGTACSGALNNPTQCTQGYTKATSNLDEVRYVWTRGGDNAEPCAAEGADGTFYEFFKTNSAANVGVNNLGSLPQQLPAGTPAFDFDQILGGTCPIPQCSSNIELLIIIDEQSSISSTTFTAMKDFAANIVNRLQPGPTYNSNTRFGLGFTTTYAPPFSQEPSILVGMSDTPNFVTNLLTPHTQQGGASDFGAAATYLLNKYWQGVAPNGVQRQVLYIIGGGDGTVTPNYAALQALYTSYGVESIVVGVDQGASQINLMQSLSTPGSFQRYNGVLNPANLNQGGGFEDLTIQALCPQTNACGADCKGFCECVTSPTCECPVCQSNPACTTFTCTNPTVGCQGQPFNCDDGAGCTNDSCVEPLGCQYETVNCQTGQVCVNSTGECITGTACTTPADCPQSDCFTSLCVMNICEFQSIDCNDGNVCTTDTCVNPGGCQNTEITCAQTSTCFVTTCVGALGNGQPDCQPTTAINCTDNDGCTIDSCVEDFGCQTKNVTCQPTSDCNFPVGCIGVDENGNEQAPECIISNSTCFPVSNTPLIAGITAGVIAAIVIAAVIAAALICFFSKKGFDAYKAKGDMGVPSMMQNPTFTENATAGDTTF